MIALVHVLESQNDGNRGGGDDGDLGDDHVDEAGGGDVVGQVEEGQRAEVAPVVQGGHGGPAGLNEVVGVACKR